MNNVLVLIVMMSCYGIILIIVIEQGFDKILKHESRLSRYIKNIDEFENLINDLDIKESKDIITYRITKIKNFIKRLKNG
mgnify:FL=1|nr:MAG TPA: hypothetical protein [Crassvirales sp.]